MNTPEAAGEILPVREELDHIGKNKKKKHCGVIPEGEISAHHLAEFALLHDIDFFKTVILVIKNEWEQFTRMQFSLPSITELKKRKISREKWLSAQDEFSLEAGPLFKVLEQTENWASSEGFDQFSLQWLIQEIIRAELHLAGLESPAVISFCQRARLEKLLLAESSAEQKEEFWKCKHEWLRLQEHLGEYLLVLESQRLRNANISNKWMVVFGTAYLELQEEAMRLDNLRMRLELLENNPDLDSDELDQLVQQVEEQKLRELDQLRLSVAHAPFLMKSGTGGSIGEAGVAQYRQHCKKLLREIWQLIHPDKLQRHPDFGSLTDSQKEELSRIWHQVMQVKEQECGFEPGYLNYEYRSLAILHDALSTIKAILGAAGVETDIRLIIQGETIDEQIAWLQYEINRLETEIELVQVELKTFLDDSEIRRKALLLNSAEEEQMETKERMLKRAEEYRREAAAIEEQIDTYLNKEKAA